MTRLGLGIYPAWQYSMDPAVNPKINPNVMFPAGITQTTVQSLSGPPITFLGPKRGVTLLGLRGFGTVADSISSIGSFLILGLAAYGGWNIFQKIRK